MKSAIRKSAGSDPNVPMTRREITNAMVRKKKNIAAKEGSAKKTTKKRAKKTVNTKKAKKSTP
jgi:hypothetical protein